MSQKEKRIIGRSKLKNWSGIPQLLQLLVLD